MLRGYLHVLLAAVLWGTIGPMSKLAFGQGMEPLEVGFWRTAFAWVFFAVHAWRIHGLVAPRRSLPVLALFGLAAPAGLYGFYMFAVTYGGVALASVLLYTAPAWVALLSWLLLKEPMSAGKLAAVALTILGVACVGLGPQLLGDASLKVGAAAVLFGLLSAVSYSLFSIFGKGWLRGFATPTVFLYGLPVAALAMLPFVTFHGFTWLSLAACLYLALFSTYGAFSSYYAGLKRLEATRASITATLEPVVASLIGFAIFDERFSSLGYLGSGLILAAVLISVLENARGRVTVK